MYLRLVACHWHASYCKAKHFIVQLRAADRFTRGLVSISLRATVFLLHAVYISVFTQVRKASSNIIALTTRKHGRKNNKVHLANTWLLSVCQRFIEKVSIISALEQALHFPIRESLQDRELCSFSITLQLAIFYFLSS